MRVEAVTAVGRVYVVEPSERKMVVYIKPSCDVVVEVGEDSELRVGSGDELKIVVRRRLS